MSKWPSADIIIYAVVMAAVFASLALMMQR